jgi:hypothetical protein
MERVVVTLTKIQQLANQSDDITLQNLSKLPALKITGSRKE